MRALLETEENILVTINNPIYGTKIFFHTLKKTYVNRVSVDKLSTGKNGILV
jgi:hypothetical protein